MAGVLGHEIGHVNARHTAERMGQQQKAQIGATLGTLLGAVLGGEQGAQMMGALSTEVAQTYLGRYSQEQEFEGDQPLDRDVVVKKFTDLAAEIAKATGREPKPQDVASLVFSSLRGIAVMRIFETDAAATAGQLDALCALGLQSRVVAAATPTDSSGQTSYLGTVIHNAPSAGTRSAPDLAAVKAAAVGQQQQQQQQQHHHHHHHHQQQQQRQ